MNNKYKVIVANKKIYKEVELSNDISRKVGTTRDCDIRFRKEQFFRDFELLIMHEGGSWKLSCGDDLYITVDGVMKLYSKELVHGDEVTVKYQESNKEVFKISLMLDFDVEVKDYNRIIDLSDCKQIILGGDSRSDICLLDDLIGTDTVTLMRQKGKMVIIDNNSKYGVYVNGNKVRASAEIKDYDFFSIIGYSFYFKFDKLYTSKHSNLKVNGLPYIDTAEQLSEMKYPKFNRNTRIKYVIPEKEVEILPPEQKPQKPKKNLVMSLVPVIAMLGLTIVLRGIVGGGGVFVIYSVCTMGIGAIMSVVSYFNDGKQYKIALVEREQSYRKYIEAKERTIQLLRAEELKIREQIYSSLQDSIGEVNAFGRRLFEKDRKDTDFLHIYIGLGRVEASCITKYNQQEFISADDDLLVLPEQVRDRYFYINNAPIVLDLRSSSGVGIVGTSTVQFDILKNLTLDITARHFHKDVKLFYILDETQTELMAWIRWFPHVYNEDLDIRNIVCDEESRKLLLEYLYSELSYRESCREAESQFNTHCIVFVFNSRGIHKHPISKYIEGCSALSYTFVFFEEHEELLPKGCREILRLEKHETVGSLLLSNNGHNVTSFKYEIIDDKTIENLALRLSPIYVDEVNLESELTSNITLFELLNIMTVDDLDLDERWSKSEVYKSMAAPLGVKTKNEIVYLNLSDKSNAHGPHGLVAGTTGSGKSEILQSYVLSAASLFHPYDVGFVIIDFKGGGMANQFKDLPHLMGAITNIDGREINRSLRFIKAELVRRQELFSEYNVNHIDAYIKLYKQGQVTEPLPHLVMIVDEFAELKAEFPDFMKEIISAARVGRTLGVHLILATQKPSGVVDGQIWSNSKFKLCLKVQTKEDSNEVIKSPLAAEIREPGRAYLQVGNNEIFELFQSAYSGAKVISGAEQNEFELYSLNTWGKKKLVYTNRRQRDNDGKNQLQAMVEYMADYCEAHGIQPLSGICLPPLPDSLYLSEIKEAEKNLLEGVIISIGLFDDPEQQRQEELLLNLSESNTYIIGSPQTGKTTLLQNILYATMSAYSPDEVNIYVVDGGNMQMKVFDGANHIGGIALIAEEEKVENLFKLLSSIISERKSIFTHKGIGTYRAYLDAGFTDLPQVLVFIDNISVFREHFSSLEESLLQLSREGLSVGINFVVTGTQTSSIGYKTLPNYGTRIAFTCNEKGEYGNLFGRCRIEPKEVPGRGLISLDKRLLEFQTALCVEGDREIERVDKIKKYIDFIKDRYYGQHADEIPVVPEVINLSELMSNRKDLYQEAYKLPVGMDYASVTYEHLDLLSLGMFAVMGRENGGKTNFLRQLLQAINRTVFENGTEAYIFDGANRKLSSCKDYGYVKTYSIDHSEAEVLIPELEQTLAHRMQKYNEAETPDLYLSKLPLILIVIKNPQLISSISADKELTASLLRIARQLKSMKACVIIADLDNTPVSFNSGELIKAVKDNKKAVILDDYSNIRFFDTGIKQQREFQKPIKQGDAYLLMGNSFKKIKTIFKD